MVAVDHQEVAVAALPTEEGGHNPRKVVGSEKKRITPDGRASEIEDTYSHHTIRGILHLGLVKLHLLLMQH